MKARYCLILMAILFLLIPVFKYARETGTVRDEQRNREVIEWYIEHKKPPYDQYESYEEYLENRE